MGMRGGRAYINYFIFQSSRLRFVLLCRRRKIVLSMASVSMLLLYQQYKITTNKSQVLRNNNLLVQTEIMLRKF